jgi:hypothetical protein
VRSGVGRDSCGWPWATTRSDWPIMFQCVPSMCGSPCCHSCLTQWLWLNGILNRSLVKLFIYLFIYWVVPGFALAKLALYHLSHSSSQFGFGYFGDGVS